MITESVEPDKKKQVKPAEKDEFFIKYRRLFAIVALVSLAFSYVWKNQFSWWSEDSSSEQNFSKGDEALPFFLAKMPNLAKEGFLMSQMPDINQELASQPSQVPVWLASAIRQQVQPSPKRVADVVLDDETNDSLVVRDRVVVIPKILHTPISSPPKTKFAKESQAKAIKKQFTIQILASRRRDDIMHFVHSHKLNRGVKIRLTKRDNQDWYVLTLGEFDQLEKAQEAVRNLSLELAKFNPWIRPLEQLRVLS